jgi:radical SAM superfamily enzyme YgiQ (UPF0313 family)
MRIALIGADNEENLGIAMIASSLCAARHQTRVIPFTELAELEDVVAGAIRYRPQLIGLAMQFQHRGWEFVKLAECLRAAGYRGHLTAGGIFATAAHAHLLIDVPAVDSVVLYDGEETIVELAAAVRDGSALTAVPGLAVRLDDGCVRRTEPRRMPQDLDRLGNPLRYRPATRHFGVPFLPISGGRGCWGKCAFCSITSYHRDARKAAGGLGLRLRSPAAIAQEMATLMQRESAPGIFCFHDETLLLPRESDTLERLGALTRELERRGIDHYGLVGKCRPDCVTDAVADALVANRVIRMYVGIENASQAGQDHLNRRTHTAQLDNALRIMNRAGIFGCYNLLIFEPDTTLGDVRENIAFIRAHADNPVNFCRAEPYHGTPLWERLSKNDELGGSWLGWDYHLHNAEAELLFRVTQTVFRQRNFDGNGVSNRSMSLGYLVQVIKHFYSGNSVRNNARHTAFVERLNSQCLELTRRISLDSAEMLERCVELVERLGPTVIGAGQAASSSDSRAPSGARARDELECATLALALEVATRDMELQRLIDAFIADAEGYVAEQSSVRRFVLPARFQEAFTGLALAGCVATVNPGCGGEADDSGDVPAAGRGGSTSTSTKGVGGNADPVVYSGGRTQTVVDMIPPTGGRSVLGSGGMVYDPLPSTGGRNIAYDSVPMSGGRGGTTTGGQSSGRGGAIGDPLPQSGGRGGASTGGYSMVDPPPQSGGRGGASTGGYSMVDPPPQSGGRGGAATAGGSTARGGSGFGGLIYDPLPPTGGRSAGGNAGTGPVAGRPAATAGAGALAANEIRSGHFRDTRTRRSMRSLDLPLFDPPDITLQAVRDGQDIVVTVSGIEGPVTMRWSSRGRIDGDGETVRWKPDGDDDQIRFAVRSLGGISVAALRVKEV